MPNTARKTTPQGVSRRHAAARRVRPALGFTIIEILVVIAVIIILLSILVVALNRAAGSAQVANTRTLLSSISQALVQFREDVGYLPPVLDDRRDLDPPRTVGAQGSLTIIQTQDWFSVTTLPDYLIGYGNEQQDGAGAAGDPTRPAPGIRSPGRDGVWSATVFGNGGLAARNGGPGTAITGQVLGPYLELRDARLLATIDGNGVIRSPSDPGYDLTAANQAAVIVDYWGRPIRYYRKAYPPGALGQPVRPTDRDGDGVVDPAPTLGDVFVLRPYEVAPGAAVDGRADANGDTTTTFELNAAEFALLSFGPDGVIDDSVRRDDVDYDGNGIAQSNADNIVEAGP